MHFVWNFYYNFGGAENGNISDKIGQLYSGMYVRLGEKV